MSVIKVNKIESTGTTDGGVEIDSSGHVQVDGVQLPTAGALSNRNLVINGGMQVSQRGTSFSFAHDGTTTAYTIDRMAFVTSGTDSFDGTVTQSTDAPDGFGNSWKLTTGTAEASIDANDLVYLVAPLEAQNLQALEYGLASAQTITLSFYVKSSITGTYGVTLYQYDGVRNRTATYAISSANTWERKTITLTGDTAGTINNDNGRGLDLAWNLATGSDHDSTDSTSWGAYVASRWAYGHAQDGVITTAGATWQITGIQLEVGEKATPFEHRSFGDELVRCQRYYETGNYYDIYGINNSSFIAGQYSWRSFSTTKRTTPTVTGTNSVGTFASVVYSDGAALGRSNTVANRSNNGTFQADAEL